MSNFENIFVVGMHFRGAEVKALVSNFIPPLTLTLEREPDNAFDPNAIKVFYGDIHIGYIERQKAIFIAPQMDEGKTFSCVVTEMAAIKNNLHPVVTLEEIDAGAEFSAD